MRKIKKLLRWYEVMSRRAAQKQVKLYADHPDLLKMQIVAMVELDSVTSSIK